MSDWIKMRGDIHRDPKVIAIAEYLGAQPEFAAWTLGFGPAKPLKESLTRAGFEAVTLGVSVTALLVTWSVTRRDGVEDGDDMILEKCTSTTLDRISGVPCFGAAMLSVGWAVEENGDRTRFPKCLNHLTSPEERERKAATERKRRQRERERDIDRDIERDKSRMGHAEVTPRLDKTREVKPLRVVADTFGRFWDSWPSSPRKVGKAKCAEIWRRRKLDPIADQIIADIKAMKETEQWQRGFEPAPLTYLNQSRWEDGAAKTGGRDEFAGAI